MSEGGAADIWTNSAAAKCSALNTNQSLLLLTEQVRYCDITVWKCRAHPPRSGSGCGVHLETADLLWPSRAVRPGEILSTRCPPGPALPLLRKFWYYSPKVDNRLCSAIVPVRGLKTAAFGLNSVRLTPGRRGNSNEYLVRVF